MRDGIVATTVAGTPMPWPAHRCKPNKPVMSASTTPADPRRTALTGHRVQVASKGLREANAHRRASNQALAVIGKVKGVQEVSHAVAWVLAP